MTWQKPKRIKQVHLYSEAERTGHLQLLRMRLSRARRTIKDFEKTLHKLDVMRSHAAALVAEIASVQNRPLDVTRARSGKTIGGPLKKRT